MLVISTPHVWKACVEMPKYLQQRYRVWYAVLDIPKDVRPKLGGKPRFVQSLKTESLSEAEILVLPLIAEWKALIQEARGQTTPSSADLVAKALHWRDELRRAQDDQHEHSVLASIVDDELWKLNEIDPKAAKIAAKISDGQSYPLDRDIDAWLAPQTVEQKTKDMKRADARRFVARFKVSHEVTRQALQNWVHHLQVSDELSTATVSRIISACRGYWEYLHVMGHIEGQETLFDRVTPKKATKTKAAMHSTRLPFAPSDLPKLLLGALDNDDLPLAQLIWMGMWTGCRIEELCSLKVEHIAKDHFTVVDSKTSAGLRKVPIHPRLAPVMRHLCTSSTDGYVLSDLSRNKYTHRSNAIGKRFGRLKAKLGFSERHVFHSLRRSLATELENMGVPENVSADIVGHEKPTMTYGLYSGGNRLEVLREALSRVNFKIPLEIERRLVG